MYSKENKKGDDFQKALKLSNQFAEMDGRRPRIMVVKMGQDGNGRGAKVVATRFADLGFDVDIGPLLTQTPHDVAKQAVENDVHVLSISSMGVGHTILVPQVIEELKNFGREDILVIAGGAIPVQDYDFLFTVGVTGVFGPEAMISESAITILNALIKNTI